MTRKVHRPTRPGFREVRSSHTDEVYAKLIELCKANSVAIADDSEVFEVDSDDEAEKEECWEPADESGLTSSETVALGFGIQRAGAISITWDRGFVATVDGKRWSPYGLLSELLMGLAVVYGLYRGPSKTQRAMHWAAHGSTSRSTTGIGK